MAIVNCRGLGERKSEGMERENEGGLRNRDAKGGDAYSLWLKEVGFRHRRGFWLRIWGGR